MCNAPSVPDNDGNSSHDIENATTANKEHDTADNQPTGVDIPNTVNITEMENTADKIPEMSKSTAPTNTEHPADTTTGISPPDIHETTRVSPPDDDDTTGVPNTNQQYNLRTRRKRDYTHLKGRKNDGSLTISKDTIRQAITSPRKK